MRAIIIAFSLLLYTFQPLWAQEDSKPAPSPFTIALLGDTQDISPRGQERLRVLIDSINQREPLFSVHIGEFKGGSDACDEAYYRRVQTTLNRFAQPVMFLLGDNDWTDCPEPLQRLAKARELFFATPQSHGQAKRQLERQSTREGFAGYPENALWTHEGVVFASFHNVGTNNNLLTDADAAAEHLARNAANLAWLDEAFTKAVAENAAAVVVLTHANLQFNNPAWRKTGFDSFREALTEKVKAFAKPVLLVHGDSHTFTIDKPMKNAIKQTVANFTRLEVFGSPDLGVVYLTIDTTKANPFSFRPVMLP